MTAAVDSEETIAAAARAGVAEVLIDVNVGLPRCGCSPEEAGRLADRARAAGLSVRGVMGYEGHIVGLEDRATRVAMIEVSMTQLARAHEDVGGDVMSAGGTGTYDLNTWATEIQAGSYALMDTAYAKLGLPFEHALSVLATVISVSKEWTVADCGLKALGMDHGNPSVEGAEVWFCSDEHLTFAPERPLRVGDRIRVLPAPRRSDRCVPRAPPRGRRGRGTRSLGDRPARVVSVPAHGRCREPGAPCSADRLGREKEVAMADATFTIGSPADMQRRSLREGDQGRRGPGRRARSPTSWSSPSTGAGLGRLVPLDRVDLE